MASASLRKKRGAEINVAAFVELLGVMVPQGKNAEEIAKAYNEKHPGATLTAQGVSQKIGQIRDNLVKKTQAQHAKKLEGWEKLGEAGLKHRAAFDEQVIAQVEEMVPSPSRRRKSSEGYNTLLSKLSLDMSQFDEGEETEVG